MLQAEVSIVMTVSIIINFKIIYINKDEDAWRFFTQFFFHGNLKTPKWVEKAKRAVFSIVTYDKNDKMLNTGNGFFVSEDGLALSDYTLFKGAERAVVITSEGKQMPVSLILGANDMYDVIKFRVAITEKKVPVVCFERLQKRFVLF